MFRHAAEAAWTRSGMRGSVPPRMSEPAPDRHPRDRLVRQLSLTDATLLVVSSVIGVGIFFTPGAVADSLPHPGVMMLAWLVGALLSLAGALANAELGAMYPHAGGDYVYLREAFHPLAGFLVGWLTFFVIYAGTVATLAMGFADGLAPFLALDTSGKVAVAIAVTVATSAVNYYGVRAGARFNNVTAILKVAALAGLAVAGPILGRGDIENLTPLVSGASEIPLAGFGLALSPVLFSYLGWNASIYVASEIRRPERNLPRSLFLGLGMCAALYLLINGVYLYAMPVEVLRHQASAGESAARILFGGAGGMIAAGLILASVLGCLNATILVGPRIAYAMALDERFFAGVEGVHRSHGTPHVAVAAQAVVAVLLIAALQRFPSILDYTTFAIVLATMADTCALYRLRWKRPDVHRPYRAWGYPVVPALYLLANAAIAVAMIWGRPLECAIAVGVLLTGLPFYVHFGRRAPLGVAP